MKHCIRCGVLQSLDDFYTHPRMKDGHLNKCKACCKADERNRRLTRPEVIRSYEKRRVEQPKRKEQRREIQRRRRQRHPEKEAARAAVRRAVRSGRIKRGPCEVCGCTDRVEAHHTDYLKPLDVRWLCFQHHRHEHGHHVNTHEKTP